jgi:nitrogen fixation/metabolism regulation signal transduction histidine kinase
MADQKNQRRSRNVLIMPDFQGRMILFVLLTGFVCMALNGYLYYQYVVDSYDFILNYSSLPEDLKEQRYSDLLVFGTSLSVATLVATFAVAIWALFATHRAAGSVYHLKRVIDEIKAGNFDARVRLREKDEFQDVARAFNELMDRLQKN